MPVDRSTKSSRGTLQQRVDANPGAFTLVKPGEQEEAKEILRTPPPSVPKKTLIPQSVYIHDYPLLQHFKNKFYIYRATQPTSIVDFKLFVDGLPHMKDEQKMWITVELNHKEVLDQQLVAGENTFGDGTMQLQPLDIIELYFSTNVQMPVWVKQINIVFTQEV